MLANAPGKTRIAVCSRKFPVPMEHHSDLAHASDLLAGYIREFYGPPYLLPGEAGPDGIIRFGRGGIYDEHRDRKHLLGSKNGRPECEATLVANRFCPDLPELQPLLEHVRPVDTRGQQKGRLRFGGLVERMWDVYPREPWRIEQWARLLFRAAILYERGATSGGPGVDPQIIVECIAEAWKRARRGFWDSVCAAVRPYLSSFLEQGVAAKFQELKPFGLPHCAVLLWRMWQAELPTVERISAFWWQRTRPPQLQGAVREWLIAWLTDAIRAELVSQQLFFEAAHDAERALVGNLTILGKRVRAAVVTSDQLRIHSFIADRYDDVVLTTVRRSIGHIQFFRRRHHQPAKIRGRMPFLAAFLRAREQERRGVTVSSWAELTAVEGPLGAADWFFDARTGNIYFGTRTAQVMHRSMLTDQDILEAISIALDDANAEVRHRFYREHAGPMGDSAAAEE